MKNFLRELVVSLGPKLLPSNKMLEKALSISIMTRDYHNVFATQRFKTRELMWKNGIELFYQKSICYLEFGVWEGQSIKKIANYVSDQNSRFFGFDSFEGLPEIWDTMTGINEKGFFSVDGKTPFTDDQRIRFIKGWFQNSVPDFIDKLRNDLNEKLVVHYDADLYSSTIFCLMHVDRLKKPYLAIFDEFPGQETRALYNYQQATGANVDFIGSVGPSAHYPTQVMAWITPQDPFEVN